MKLCKCRSHNSESESEETAMERRKLTKEDIDKVRNIEYGHLFKQRWVLPDL